MIDSEVRLSLGYGNYVRVLPSVIPLIKRESTTPRISLLGTVAPSVFILAWHDLPPSAISLLRPSS